MHDQTPPFGGDYFALLSLAPAFDLDPAALDAAYFAAMRACHPDRFVGKPPGERERALRRSAEINRAYETLKDPLARAQHLLHLRGIAVGAEQAGVPPSPALLMESMERRERIEEARDAAALRAVEDTLAGEYLKIVENVAALYKASRWQEMAQETLRLGYAVKAREALLLRLEKNGTGS